MGVCIPYGRQFVLLIISKLGMVIEGHLAGKIDLVSCAKVYGGLRKRRIKGEGVNFFSTEK